MGNRSRTEIVGNILDAANGGTSKTKIMYTAFLSFGQLKEYLSVLVENNLIEYLEGANKYKTTEKGLNFLKMHNQIEELLQTTTKNNWESVITKYSPITGDKLTVFLAPLSA